MTASEIEATDPHEHLIVAGGAEATEAPTPAELAQRNPETLTDEQLAEALRWLRATAKTFGDRAKAQAAGRASGNARRANPKFDPQAVLDTYWKKHRETGGYGAHKATCSAHGCAPATLTRYLRMFPKHPGRDIEVD